VVNAASLAAHRPFAPGSLITIFGQNLADGPLASNLPLATELGGALVALGDRALPLQFTQDSQINAVIPYDIPVNVTHQLIIRHGARTTVPLPLTMAVTQPAVFTTTQTGQGQGAILIFRGAQQPDLADSAHPARVGDTITIYCAGLGAVTPPVLAGVMAPLDRLSLTANPVTVTIADIEARVDFAGLAPGFAGLYQINAVIPQGITPGNDVPVRITVAGQTSPPATISVQ
jgi:uncharacterized protein (TIGR03437 family)